MNELQRNKLIQFNSDEVMRKSVEEVLFSVCNLNELLDAKTEYSNSQLGQIVRAYKSAEKLLKLGFREIDKFQNEKAGTQPKIPPGL